MGLILDTAEGYWTGAISPDERPPYAPLMDIAEVLPRTAFVSSFANVTALDTDEGLVLIDTGSFLFSRDVKAQLRTYSKRPLHTAVYTHGHVDHVFGVELYEAERGERARVIAHEALPARFDRYKLTAGYNACINARQFQVPTAWPVSYRYPDVTFEKQLTFEVGGEKIELRHTRGETDDHAWAWVPSRKLLCTGDLFIWAVPNAGNPQKVQRYCGEWAVALRAMAALPAEVLCPGHGPPILGNARIVQALTDSAALLESLHDQTLALMNAGARLDEVLRTVRAPADLLERPYLRPIYDEPEFIVRNVWRLYGGWHDGNPAHLKPGSDRALASEIAALAGGAKRLADRAVELAAKGEQADFALACHLAEMAALDSPHDEGIRDARARVYEKRAGIETSLMARGIFSGAARENVPDR